jgi:S-formylglutathione hydrolase FrmB
VCPRTGETGIRLLDGDERATSVRLTISEHRDGTPTPEMRLPPAPAARAASPEQTEKRNMTTRRRTILHGRRVRIPAALALGAVMVFGCGHPPARTAEAVEAVAATRTETGIALVNQKRLSARLSELTFTSSALDGTTNGAEKGHRYPVLYLYHGGGQSASSWTQDGAAEEITADLPAIVVMPDAGSTEWYADWWNNGHRGRPMWETFHINRLLPWVDEHYRTIPERGARASAGLSMGGFGAVSYAARHPDLFGAVGSFSGDVDHQNVEMRTIIE